MKIMIAEDHLLFVDALKSLLRSKGYDVIGVASDGLEALEKAKKLKPDIIFMDVNMPKCNGIEATMLIHNILPDIVIIILTASEEEEDVYQAIKCGASGYMVKTFDGDALFQILEKVKEGQKPLFPELEEKMRVQNKKDDEKRQKGWFRFRFFE